MAGRIIGLDLGSKTVGVAVSDPLRVTAQGVEIIRRTSEGKLRKTYARIEELVREYGAERIIVGLPKHMNNDEGVRAEKSRAFAENLARRTGLPVELYDERLTTVAADRAMNEMRIRGADRKKFVDEIAAVLILQGYLDGLAMKKNS